MKVPRSRSPLLALVVSSLLLAGPPVASAAAGDLDTSFSSDGRVTTAFGSDSRANAVAMQGKKIIAGGYATKANDDFAIVRYRANGSRDETFGKNGRARIDFGRDDQLEDLVVLRNGKILAVGSAEGANGNGRFGIARLTADGKPDPAFGRDGKVTMRFGEPSAVASAVVLLSKGRFAVAGSSGDPGGTRVAVARYLPDGRLDTRFSGDGKVLTGFWPGAEHNTVVDLVRWGDSDWVVPVAQTSPDGGGLVDIGLARYTARGKLDPLFGGGDGKAVEDFSDYDYIHAAVLQKNNFLLVGGYADFGSGWDSMFVRFSASGNVDASWGGGDGIVSHEGGTSLEYWFDLAGSGGKTVAVGEVDGHAALMRILKSGAVDTTFGPAGWVLTAFPGGDSTLRAVTIQDNGRIVAAGQAVATLVVDGFAVERLLPA